jgi:uncharacterized membrane protein YcaP (DUF421 family)
MGKRQIGELQPCELVITILISELATIPIQDTDMPILYGILPIMVLSALEIGISLIALKFISFRHLLYGRPITIIRNGKIDQKQMRRARISVDDLVEAMRAEGIANIRDVGLAVLETNGNVSVIDKKDADISEIIITDGVFDKAVLKRLKLSKKEVLTAIKEKSEKRLFLVTREKDGKYYTVKRKAE